MADAHRTAFEAGFFSDNSLLEDIALLVLVLCACALVIRLWRRNQDGRTRWPFVLVYVFVLLLVLSRLWGSVDSACANASALRNGECTVVEGTVEVVTLAPKPRDRGSDHIRVNGHDFHINPYTSAGYNRTVVRGGVLTAGKKVRLHYANRGISKEILKVEVADDH